MKEVPQTSGNMPPEDDDSDDEKDSLKNNGNSKDIIKDKNFFEKTIQKTVEKVYTQLANEDDKIGVGNTQIVIPTFMKTYCKLFEDSGMM